MTKPQPYTVGRQSEVECFDSSIAGRVPHWLLNIYGPGGIGKTVVGHKMMAYVQAQDVPLAFVDGIHPDLTPDRILHAISAGLSTEKRLAQDFRPFDRTFDEYLIVQEVLQSGGGLPMDKELRSAVADLTEAVESSLSLDRKLELALPLLPLLTYKIELGVGSELDLHALWDDLQARWEGLVERFGRSWPPSNTPWAKRQISALTPCDTPCGNGPLALRVGQSLLPALFGGNAHEMCQLWLRQRA